MTYMMEPENEPSYTGTEEELLAAAAGALEAQVEAVMTRLWPAHSEFVADLLEAPSYVGLETDDVELAAGGALHKFADAAIDADAFARQVRLCQMSDMPMIATVMEDGLVPLDMRPWLGPALPGTRALRRDDLVRELVMETVRDGSWDAAHPVVHMPPEEAEASFVSRLTRFVRTRLSALGSDGTRAGDDAPFGPPGTLVTVETRRRGLRVYYSPFYWLTDNRVFGAPTTPVRSYLDPGDYRFGCSGRGQAITWDTGLFEIPRVTEITLQV